MAANSEYVSNDTQSIDIDDMRNRNTDCRIPFSLTNVRKVAFILSPLNAAVGVVLPDVPAGSG